MKIYWTPDGRYCASRRVALKLMTDVLASSAEDVAVMRAGLLEEGWQNHSDLPPGWLVRNEGHGGHGRTKSSGWELNRCLLF